MAKRYPFASRAEGGVNRWKENVGLAIERNAAQRQCPAYGRKSALKRVEPPHGGSIKNRGVKGAGIDD